MTFGRVAAALLLFTAPLAACNAAPNGGAAGVADSGSGAQTGLRTTALTITQGPSVHRFTVEVAETPEQQSRGMMFRTSMAPDRGMLFPFDPPRFGSFWMRNTLIPLDMIFIRADGTIDRIAENRPPQDDTPTTSGGIVSAVLELPGGTAARLGLDESGVVRWSPPR